MPFVILKLARTANSTTTNNSDNSDNSNNSNNNNNSSSSNVVVVVVVDGLLQFLIWLVMLAVLVAGLLQFLIWFVMLAVLVAVVVAVVISVCIILWFLLVCEKALLLHEGSAWLTEIAEGALRCFCWLLLLPLQLSLLLDAAADIATLAGDCCLLLLLS